ncbi:hypothetical protein NL676_013956 [Syzygium grande]|nr:hypothetical protein NL676_013956 [Syzygium grande]
MEQEDGGDSAALGMGLVENGEMIGAKPKGSFRRWADALVGSQSSDERTGTSWKSRWTASFWGSRGDRRTVCDGGVLSYLCMYQNDYLSRRLVCFRGK